MTAHELARLDRKILSDCSTMKKKRKIYERSRDIEDKFRGRQRKGENIVNRTEKKQQKNPQKT